MLAAPATSRRLPKFELVDIPTTDAVPLIIKLPLPSGVPAVGRTRTFCQVNFVSVPPLLLVVTVYVICVEVTEVTLPTTILLPEPPDLALETLGVGLPVSKIKPAGALRTNVPVPTFPLAFSV